MTTRQKQTTSRKNSQKNLASEKNKVGRPPLYSLKLAHKICGLIATTPASLKSICLSNPELPSHQTIYRWLYQHAQFRDLYARAREAQAHIFSDAIIDISSDDSDDFYFDSDGNRRTNSEAIQRSRLRVDTLKFLMSKHLPKVYGEKIQIAERHDEENEKELIELRTKLDAAYKREY